jgi:hypothetical protein
MICYPVAAMSLLPPTPLRLMPGVLRARGLEVGLKKLQTALRSGAIPGRHERGRWFLSEADLDAAELYFRDLAARGSRKGGAAALDRAKGRPPQSSGSH